MPDDYENQNTETEEQESESENNNQNTGDGKSRVNASATFPYLVAFSPNTSLVSDYSRLKSARISAVMFFGGELYTAGHYKQSTYMNPYLPNLVEQCNKSGMPFGLYVNVRARDVIEAENECKSLYYILAHYPPILGIWLSLKTTNMKSVNDDILEVYYKYIDKWGLGQRCGLYLDKYELSNITWTSFQDRFYLWLISAMSVSEIDDELLDPVMFEVD